MCSVTRGSWKIALRDLERLHDSAFNVHMTRYFGFNTTHRALPCSRHFISNSVESNVSNAPLAIDQIAAELDDEMSFSAGREWWSNRQHSFSICEHPLSSREQWTRYEERRKSMSINFRRVNYSYTPFRWQFGLSIDFALSLSSSRLLAPSLSSREIRFCLSRFFLISFTNANTLNFN